MSSTSFALTRAVRRLAAIRNHTLRGFATNLSRTALAYTPQKSAFPTNSVSATFGGSVQTRLNSNNASGRPFWDAPSVDYEYVKKKSDQPSTNSYIIDVREPDEIAQGSIPSSVAIPLSGLNHSLTLPDIEFEAKHGFKKPAKDEEIIFYCRSGKRSATAADEAKNRGWTNIKNYSGSWLDWVEKEQQRKKKDNDDDD